MTKTSALEKSERHPAAGARLVGRADPKEVLSVTIYVRRRPDAAPLPDPANSATTPTGQRAHLTRQQFAEQYGASPADLDRVAAFARDYGLTVVESSVPKQTIILSGTVEKMNRAFGVKLGLYESPEEAYRGREGKIHVPRDIAEIVEGVFGLDNRQTARPLSKIGGST